MPSLFRYMCKKWPHFVELSADCACGEEITTAHVKRLRKRQQRLQAEFLVMDQVWKIQVHPPEQLQLSASSGTHKGPKLTADPRTGNSSWGWALGQLPAHPGVRHIGIVNWIVPETPEEICTLVMEPESHSTGRRRDEPQVIWWIQKGWGGFHCPVTLPIPDSKPWELGWFCFLPVVPALSPRCRHQTWPKQKKSGEVISSAEPFHESRSHSKAVGSEHPPAQPLQGWNSQERE